MKVYRITIPTQGVNLLTTDKLDIYLSLERNPENTPITVKVKDMTQAEYEALVIQNAEINANAKIPANYVP